MWRLYKKQKLCSAVAINSLFSRDASVFTALAFPLRVAWRYNPGRQSDAPIQFLISIPKKKVRHAVDRVKMRRRVREAFRLNHQKFPLPDDIRIDLAFVYVDTSLQPYSKVERAVCRLLSTIQSAIESQTDTESDTENSETSKNTDTK